MTTVLQRLGRGLALTAATGLVATAVTIAVEVALARTRRYAQPVLGMAVRTTVGAADGPPMRLVLLGDAVAVGVGVTTVDETVGGQLAELLADGTGGKRVELSSVGVAGSRSADLGTQVSRALLGHRPDVAVILIGAGDATSLRSPRTAAAHVAAAVRRLRDAGVEVVVGTCPDLGATRAFAPPLRQIVGWLGRRVARAQTAAVHAAGGDVVDLAAEAGPVFRADPGALCFDGFHPSADGYRVWAHALFPAVLAAATARPHPRS